MVKFFRDNMAAMVEGGVELVFCNESEALEWGQCDDLDAAIEAIKSVLALVITLAPRRGDLGW